MDYQPQEEKNSETKLSQLDETPENNADKPRLTEGFDQATEERLANESVEDSGSRFVEVSRYISAIFSPMLMPSYCVALAMWLTPLSDIAENTRLIVSLVVLFLTGIIPFAMLFALLKAGYVNNLDVSNRTQRLIPILAISLCYIAATIYIHRIKGSDWLAMIYVGAFAAGVICAIVSTFWKISAHGTAAGAVIGLLMRFVVSELNVIPMLPWVIGAILLGGIIGVSRMVLRAHTPGEYIAGEVLGAVCVFVATGLPLPFVETHIL